MRVSVCCLVGLVVLSLAQARAAEAIPGIGPTGPITKVEGDYQFTEGPAADRHGNLYFSDIPANRIYKIDPQGKVALFLEPSGHTNGLMVIGSGEIAACQMDGQVVAIGADDKAIRPLAQEYEGARFNAPNDLVVDRSGGVYFTDPHFRAPEPLPQGKTAVYYVSVAGKVTRLLDDLKAPNGVILSPDEQTLYVIPSGSAVMMAYPVEGPGKLGAGREFCRLAQAPGRSGGGGDGLTIDTQGNLYITSGLGLQVFDKAGKALGVIEFPEQPANATFGGPDGKTLFVTARKGVYTAPMEAKGHVFPAGGQ